MNAQACDTPRLSGGISSAHCILLWIRHIKFEHYELLHSRIAASVMPDFTEEEAEESSHSDWQEDLQRFGNKEEQLDQQQFGHAMFQLVDEWCRGASSTQMIVGWLRMLFSNIVDVYGNLKKISEIGCIGKSAEVIYWTEFPSEVHYAWFNGH